MKNLDMRSIRGRWNFPQKTVFLLWRMVFTVKNSEEPLNYEADSQLFLLFHRVTYAH